MSTFGDALTKTEPIVQAKRLILETPEQLSTNPYRSGGMTYTSPMVFGQCQGGSELNGGYACGEVTSLLKVESQQLPKANIPIYGREKYGSVGSMNPARMGAMDQANVAQFNIVDNNTNYLGGAVGPQRKEKYAPLKYAKLY